MRSIRARELPKGGSATRRSSEAPAGRPARPKGGVREASKKPQDMRALAASLALLLAAPPAPPVEDRPHALDHTSLPGVLVTVRTLAIDGLDGLGVDENALLASSVALAWDDEQIPPGWVAPRSRLVTRPIPLWQLGGADRTGTVLHGSALNAVLAALEADLRARGVPSARVELDRKALLRLSTPGSDGLLLVNVWR